MAASSEPVRVLIVDDQPIFSEALRLFLERDRRIQVVGVAEDGKQAIDLALLREAEVVLMDVAMPAALDGLEATRRLLTIRPQARVLILSGISREGIEDEALAAGAAGFLLKGDIADGLVERVLALAPQRHH